MTLDDTHDRDSGTETTTPFETTWPWRGGGIAGLVATFAMGVAISLMDLSTLQFAIAGLYGQSGNLVSGWVAHLVHGSLFGMLFSLILSDPGLYRLTDWHWKSTLAGVVYGLMLAIVGAGIVMPVWLRVAGFGSPPSVPNVTVPLLVWHLVYGVVLGGVFPFVEDR
jgi:hypothetical protein